MTELYKSPLKNKKGIITGIANNHSIAWGIAKAIHNAGGEMMITYQSSNLESRVKPLAEEVNATKILQCDLSNKNDIQNVVDEAKNTWDGLDFIVHAVAFADKDDLNNRYIETSKEGFDLAMNISCYTFTALAQAAEPILNDGSSLITLSYDGSNRVMPHYNVMGVAKAALEASVRYLAADLGDKNVRVNAISAGPMRTLAGAAISGARAVYRWQGENSMLQRNIDLDDLGKASVYLLSPLSSAVTGELHYVDAGYNSVGMMTYHEE